MHVLNQFLFSYFIWLFILFCLYVLRFSIQSMCVYKMFFFFCSFDFCFLIRILDRYVNDFTEGVLPSQ